MHDLIIAAVFLTMLICPCVIATFAGNADAEA